uniref:Uncharacterized protein n=1 Tax=Sinocyclocheilus grahami TaxID=75366 RepID=A0A672QYK0_SINGR
MRLNTPCFQTSTLSDCSITEEGYKALASALRSNPSHLIELDLTGNDPGQSGVKQLDDLLQDPDCQLKTLRLNNNSITEEGCAALTSAFNLNPSNLIELDLSGNTLENSGMKKIFHLVENKQCRLEKLKLSNCELTEKSCSVLATVLSSKTILKEMNLNNSRLLDSGVKEICEGLKNPVCELEILKKAKKCFCNIMNCVLLSDCSISDEGYLALASALRSNPSHLIELDLTGNDPGQSGVKQLDDLLQDPDCQLKTLRLSNCGITEEGYLALASALRSNPSHLIELDLTGNDPGPSGVEQLNDLLQDPDFYCSITEEGYKALASALRSNPSHLIELDLTGNDPGPSGVKQLSDLLQDGRYKLNTIRWRNLNIFKSCTLKLTFCNHAAVLHQ